MRRSTRNGGGVRVLEGIDDRGAKEESVINGLATDDYGGAKDVLGSGAAVEFSSGFAETGEDTSVAIDVVADEGEHFGGDVPASDIWKDEDVGLTSHRADGIFLGGDTWMEGGIDL